MTMVAAPELEAEPDVVDAAEAVLALLIVLVAPPQLPD